MSVQNRENELL